MAARLATGGKGNTAQFTPTQKVFLLGLVLNSVVLLIAPDWKALAVTSNRDCVVSGLVRSTKPVFYDSCVNASHQLLPAVSERGLVRKHGQCRRSNPLHCRYRYL